MKLLLFLMLAATAQAQFSSAFLQDDQYWGDGKAEFNIYIANEVRYGERRACEIVHILVREPFSEREVVKAEPGSPVGSYPVIKLNQILHVPTGIYVYQQMHSAFWRCDSGDLVKATLTSNDSCGNSYKELRALGGLRGLLSNGWRYEWRTYWEEMSGGEENITAPNGAIFADELPLRVRMIDFGEGVSGEFPIRIGASIVNSKKDTLVFQEAAVRWKRHPDSGIGVEIFEKMQNPKVAIERRTAAFRLESDPPRRLLSWLREDGSTGELRQSLKIDYWRYNMPGDRERALREAAPAVDH
jgi:hypothetical protein